MARAVHILGAALPLDHLKGLAVNIDEATGQAVITFLFRDRTGHLPATGGYIPA
jgi:hypothetical protein